MRCCLLAIYVLYKNRGTKPTHTANTLHPSGRLRRDLGQVFVNKLYVSVTRNIIYGHLIGLIHRDGIF